jgi:hypothetical protein
MRDHAAAESPDNRLLNPGRRLFLYDMADDKAQGVDLMFQKENKLEELKNAEGVALNFGGDILFVVTDDGDESVLVSYEILQ